MCDAGKLVGAILSLEIALFAMSFIGLKSEPILWRFLVPLIFNAGVAGAVGLIGGIMWLCSLVLCH